MSDNKVIKERARGKGKQDLRNKTLSQIDLYSSLLEGERHQSLAKPDQKPDKITTSFPGSLILPWERGRQN